MNTHGMSIVAGYFMTVFQAKTWYRITFNLKPHEFKIFRSWTYFMLPFVSEEYKAHFMAIMMMMIWWLIRERAYDNNIRKILKYFQKQRLWWEHRNILETAQSHCVEETSPKFCLIVKTNWRGLARWVNSVSNYTHRTWHFFAQLFSKNFRYYFVASKWCSSW